VQSHVKKTLSITALVSLTFLKLGAQTSSNQLPNAPSLAQLQEKARMADVEASREDIVLATDQVFFQVLEAQETLKVASQTVASRQSVTDQVTALTSSKLKSDLDLSFAQVNLSQAKLLRLDAQNNLDAAKAALSAVLGYDKEIDYQLTIPTRYRRYRPTLIL
jgi:outer membrane protein